MTTLAPDHATRTALDDAGARLMATLDGLSDDAWRAPSLLPGWSRAHVAAHLSLNAEGLGGVLTALRAGVPAHMYTSNEARDADIEELAAAEPTVVRERLRRAGDAFSAAVREAPDALWSGVFQRVPGDRDLPATALHPMRHREVEIHHADLGADYTHGSWPPAFSTTLLDTLVADRAGQGPFTVVADDLGVSRQVGGAGGTTVRGAAADLGWWLLGRGAGEGLRADAGDVPDLGAWRGARHR